MNLRMILDGYIRVSSLRGREGESFISPSVQREQIESWASHTKTHIGEVFEELDESGARKDRPFLDAAIQRVEAGESHGIVVAKLDRFGRSLIDGLANIERIDAAGGTFVSVHDGLDIATPTGKLILRIMLSMAEWELDRIRANWEIAKSRAVSRGIHMSYVPIGYQRGEDRRLVVDGKAGPVVAELFRRRAAGASYTELSAYLNESGVRSIHGARFVAAKSIARIVRNRVYLGEVRNGSHFNPAAHPALVDPGTWLEAQLPTPDRAKPLESYLSGLLRCASCGLAMACDSRTALYSCPGQSSVGACPARAKASADQIEPLLEEFAIGRAGRSHTRGSSSRIARCERALEEASADLKRYRDNSRLEEQLGDASFRDGLAVRQEILETRVLQLAAARRGARTPTGLSRSELEADWVRMTIEERRAVLEHHIECVFVEAGDATLLERVHVCSPGAAPIDTPRRGRPIGRLRPFAPTSASAERLQAPKIWAARRVEKDLRLFLNERNRWPGYREFADSGRGRLYHQVLLWGGPYYWAARFGLRPGRRTVHWNDERIHAALSAVLKDQQVWPTSREFKAWGLGPLRSAVIRHRGIPYWADRFGVEVRVQGTRSWTDDKIESDLMDLISALGRYPTPKQFVAERKVALYDAICRSGGHRHWERRLAASIPKP